MNRPKHTALATLFDRLSQGISLNSCPVLYELLTIAHRNRGNNKAPRADRLRNCAAVLMALTTQCDLVNLEIQKHLPDGTFTPITAPYIAKAVGISLRAVEYALKDLTDAGLIEAPKQKIKFIIYPDGTKTKDFCTVTRSLTPTLFKAVGLGEVLIEAQGKARARAHFREVKVYSRKVEEPPRPRGDSEGTLTPAADIAPVAAARSVPAETMDPRPEVTPAADIAPVAAAPTPSPAPARGEDPAPSVVSPAPMRRPLPSKPSASGSLAEDALAFYKNVGGNTGYMINFVNTSSGYAES